MAQFFKLTTPTYIDNTIYSPPADLIEKVILNEDANIDKIIAQQDFLNNIKIDHIATPEDEENVKRIKQKYSDKLDNIVNPILKNPLEWRNHINDIKTVQKEMNQDFLDGDISKITNNYNAYTKWLADHEKLRKENPVVFQAALTDAMKRFGGDSLKNNWSQEQVIDDPDFDKYVTDAAKILKADGYDSVEELPDGRGYIVKKNGKVEELSVEKVTNYLLNKFLSDPKNLYWAKQRQQWGLGTYFDESGKFMTPEIVTEKVTGSDGKQKEVTRYKFNEKSSLTPYLRNALGITYKKTENGISYKPDGTYNAKQSLYEQHRHNVETENLGREKFEFDKQKHQDDLNKGKGTSLSDKDIKKLQGILTDTTATDEDKRNAVIALRAGTGMNYKASMNNINLDSDFFNQKKIWSEQKNGGKNLINQTIDKLAKDFTKTFNGNNSEFNDTQRKILKENESKIKATVQALLHTSTSKEDFNQKLSRYLHDITGTNNKMNTKLGNAEISFLATSNITKDKEKYNNIKSHADKYDDVENLTRDVSGYLFGDEARILDPSSWSRRYRTNVYKNEVVDKYNNSIQNIQFTPLSTNDIINVTDMFKGQNEYKEFTYYNEKGEKIDYVTPKNIDKLVGVTGGNNYGTAMNELILTNGKKVYAVPNNEDLQEMQQVINYAVAKNLKPNDPFYIEFSNKRLNRIKTDLQMLSSNYNKNPILPLSSYIGVEQAKNLDIQQIKHNDTGESDYIIKDRKTNTTNYKFNNVEELNNFLNQIETEEYAKQQSKK